MRHKAIVEVALIVKDGPAAALPPKELDAAITRNADIALAPRVLMRTKDDARRVAIQNDGARREHVDGVKDPGRMH